MAESHLGGRTELSAELMFQLVRLLSRGLTTQMDISDPQTLMEPEYRYSTCMGICCTPMSWLLYHCGQVHEDGYMSVSGAYIQTGYSIIHTVCM